MNMIFKTWHIKKSEILKYKIWLDKDIYILYKIDFRCVRYLTQTINLTSKWGLKYSLNKIQSIDFFCNLICVSVDPKQGHNCRSFDLYYLLMTQYEFKWGLRIHLKDKDVFFHNGRLSPLCILFHTLSLSPCLTPPPKILFPVIGWSSLWEMRIDRNKEPYVYVQACVGAICVLCGLPCGLLFAYLSLLCFSHKHTLAQFTMISSCSCMQVYFVPNTYFLSLSRRS